MRYALFAVALTLAAGTVVSTTPYAPQHHNIPATLEVDSRGLRPGDILYLCATLPRPYATQNTTLFEEDHYLQMSPCPVNPIP